MRAISFLILLAALNLPGGSCPAAESGSFDDALRAESGMNAPQDARPGMMPEMQPQNMPTMPTMPVGESPGSVGAGAAKEDLTVDKATGDNAYRVEEIFARAGELNGKTVRVRGKVVKISRMIMGKNWLHIQDGTGDADKRHHDLVATTLDEATPGEIVTVGGAVAAGRDFGMGYRYEVLLEDAKVER